MPLNSPHRLPQCIRPGMLVIRMRSLMLMEHNHRFSCRPFAVMDVPYMPGVPGHNGHIIIADGNNAEVLWVQAFQIFRIKHSAPPFLQTMQPMPALPPPPSALNPFHQNTYCRLLSEASGSHRHCHRNASPAEPQGFLPSSLLSDLRMPCAASPHIPA